MIDYILNHKTTLKKLKMLKLCSLCSLTISELEINMERWKGILNILCVTKEITWEIERYFELNENENSISKL